MSLKGKKTKQVILRENLTEGKKVVTFDLDQVIAYLQKHIIAGQSHHIILKDTLSEELAKNPKHVFHDVIEDVCLSFDLKQDIAGWSVDYYPPAMRDEDGKFSTRKIDFGFGSVGVGIRIFVCLAEREVLNLQIEKPVQWSDKVRLFPGEAFCLTYGKVQQMETFILNTCHETLKASNGRRELKNKKRPERRHFLIMDGYLNTDKFAERVQTVVEENTGQKLDFIKDLKNSASEIISKHLNSDPSSSGVPQEEKPVFDPSSVIDLKKPSSEMGSVISVEETPAPAPTKAVEEQKPEMSSDSQNAVVTLVGAAAAYDMSTSE